MCFIADLLVLTKHNFKNNIKSLEKVLYKITEAIFIKINKEVIFRTHINQLFLSQSKKFTIHGARAELPVTYQDVVSFRQKE